MLSEIEPAAPGEEGAAPGADAPGADSPGTAAKAQPDRPKNGG
jgi:hypothetical protein